jgi:hypothetical protein
MRLYGKFAAWHKHKNGGVHLRLHRLQNGEHVAQSLAAASGRKQHKRVVPAHFAEHLLLHGIKGLDT